MATYEVEPLMTPDERLTRFKTGDRTDDLLVASYVQQFFPEIYDQAAAYATRRRAESAEEERAA